LGAPELGRERQGLEGRLDRQQAKEQTEQQRIAYERCDVIRVPARSLKEQFSRSSEAWKEQSDPIFRFWAEGDWWGFPFFSLSASRYFGEKETLLFPWLIAQLDDE
jgi:hypothetical protein